MFLFCQPKDLDAFISDHCFGSLVTYHENTGTATHPIYNSFPTKILITDWGIGFAMLAFGDLDGDGDYDALVNGYRGPVFKYLENTGTPTSPNFTSLVNDPYGLSIPLTNSSEWAQFVDWDCDGDLDILNSHWQIGANHNDWLLYIYENKGTPKVPSFKPPLATNQMIMAIALGDLDGDGDKDILSDEYYFKNISTTNCVTLPTASFSKAVNGASIEFTSTCKGKTTTCQPMKYSWDFGDGTTSAEQAPKHIFASGGTFKVCLTVEDVGGKATLCEDVKVVLTGTDEQNADGGMVVFPNPASDFFIIKIADETPKQQVTLQLVNTLGLVVRSNEYELSDFSKGIRISLSDLAHGFYTIKINKGGKILSAKILKVE